MAVMIGGLQNQVHASSSIRFDEVKDMGGFDSPQMKSVIQLWDPKGDFDFNDKLQQQFLKSNTLTNLRTLELKNMNINDEFIGEMCNNPTFARLMNIDLSGNENITHKSLKYIFDSNIVASIRDLPQISGRHGCAASEIYITINDTGITKEDVEIYCHIPRRNFVIQYLNPRNDTASYPTANGIKWLQFR